MKRFWDVVLEPTFEDLRPKTIVEIGSDLGGNTENLLRYCERNGAVLHVIDPAPKYEISELLEQHGERLVFHKDLSLNALPRIERFDAVLIDGDHNWYTVFSELKIIEKLCDERSRGFPLVILHDIGWPYGRRDLYYAPETIPEDYRKPHESKGMRLGVSELVEEGGLNAHLHNAVREGESKEGVLTAVEDFLKDTDEELEFAEIPGIHGLGMLFPPEIREENPGFAQLLRGLQFSPFVTRYIEQVERDRLDVMIRMQAAEVQRRHLEEEHRRAQQDIEKLARWIEELEDGFIALTHSKQWKVGHALGEAHRRVLLKSKQRTALDHIDDILKRFHGWREAHERTDAAVSGE